MPKNIITIMYDIVDALLCSNIFEQSFFKALPYQYFNCSDAPASNKLPTLCTHYMYTYVAIYTAPEIRTPL